MQSLTRMTLGRVDKSDQSGPTFQIDPNDAALRESLITLRDELLAADPPAEVHTAPELLANQVGAQADIIVEALLASNGEPVHLWALARAMPHGYGAYCRYAITQACGRIGELEGVRVTLPG